MHAGSSLTLPKSVLPTSTLRYFDIATYPDDIGGANDYRASLRFSVIIQTEGYAVYHSTVVQGVHDFSIYHDDLKPASSPGKGRQR